MIKIEADFILAHVLKDKKICDLKYLVELKRYLEENVSDLYVPGKKHGGPLTFGDKWQKKLNRGY